MLGGLLRKLLGGHPVLGVEEDVDEVVQGELSTAAWRRRRSAMVETAAPATKTGKDGVREVRRSE